MFFFWKPQLDTMATWLWELRQMHQGIAHRLKQLGACPREIVGIQGNMQQPFDGMSKLNSEAKKARRKTAKHGGMGSENKQPGGRTVNRGRQSTRREKAKYARKNSYRHGRFFQHFLPSIHARIEQLEIDTPT